MIKKKVKKVSYQVWEECWKEDCEGVVNTTSSVTHENSPFDFHKSACQDCGTVQMTQYESPRIVEEYEEVLE